MLKMRSELIFSVTSSKACFSLWFLGAEPEDDVFIGFRFVTTDSCKKSVLMRKSLNSTHYYFYFFDSSEILWYLL